MRLSQFSVTYSCPADSMSFLPTRRFRRFCSFSDSLLSGPYFNCLPGARFISSANNNNSFARNTPKDDLGYNPADRHCLNDHSGSLILSHTTPSVYFNHSRFQRRYSAHLPNSYVPLQMYPRGIPNQFFHDYVALVQHLSRRCDRSSHHEEV